LMVKGPVLAAAPLQQDPVGDEVVFHLGHADSPDAVTSGTIDLPAGKYASLRVLTTAIEGSQTRQTFFKAMRMEAHRPSTRLADWAGAARFAGEAEASTVPYRVMSDGS